MNNYYICKSKSVEDFCSNKQPDQIYIRKGLYFHIIFINDMLLSSTKSL